MPSQVRITGTPLRVRKETYKDKPIYCIDFEEGGKSLPPKGLPQPNKTPVTVFVNEKQYKKVIEGKNLNKMFVGIDGYVVLDVPASMVKGEFGVGCLKIEEYELEKK